MLRNTVRKFSLLACLLLLVGGANAEDESFVEERANFSVSWNSISIPYRTMLVSALPGKSVKIEAHPKQVLHRFKLEVAGVQLAPEAKNKWVWKAPSSSGLLKARLVNLTEPDQIELNIFVLVPAKLKEGEYINLYRIGSYPVAPLGTLAMTSAPKGYIEVSKENEKTLVGPHFQLGQFVSDRSKRYPKYIVLRTKLVLRMERILASVNSAGWPVQTFSVLQGYRTPYANKQFGGARLSRHQWGEAADIIIDESPKDGVMDDLNGDALIDANDEKTLRDAVNKALSVSKLRQMSEFLNEYKQAQPSPFVHVTAE